jgi:hypothetical protein
MKAAPVVMDLFEWQAPAAARDTDPDTSHAAARRSPSLRARDRREALFAHAAYPAGLTDFELGALIGRQQTSAGKRRGELRDAGLIEDAGERRAAPSGASAIVWRITEPGIEAAAALAPTLGEMTGGGRR